MYCKKLALKDFLHVKYKNYRNAIVKLIKLSKNNYYKHYFNNNINNSKKMWKGINDIIFNNKYKVNKFSLKINDNLTKDSSVIANTFNNFFSSIAQNLQTKIPNFGDFKTFVKKNKSLNSFFFRAATPNEMLLLLLLLLLLLPLLLLI